MKSRILLTVAAAGLLCAQPLDAQPAKPPAKPAAAAPASPWAKVPALPTACYSSQDKWSEQNTAAFNAVQQDHYKQNDINDAIRQNSVDNTDLMAVAARLQQKMMEDPASAQKYMEQMMAQNQKAQAEAPFQTEREQQIEAESAAVMKQYEAALEKAYGTGNARLDALLKKYKPSLPGAFNLWLRYGESGEPAWVEPERRAILKQWDAAYAATCPQWFGTGGQFHAYMKRYKDFLVVERIPFEKQGDKARLEQYETYGTPTTGWRTVTDYEAAEDYMNMARTLFDQRETAIGCQHPCQ